MSTMIIKGKEMIRISPKGPKRIEVSTSNGLVWSVHFSGANRVGTFFDLADSGRELLATTSEGLFYSTNNGLTWALRSKC